MNVHQTPGVPGRPPTAVHRDHALSSMVNSGSEGESRRAAADYMQVKSGGSSTSTTTTTTTGEGSQQSQSPITASGGAATTPRKSDSTLTADVNNDDDVLLRETRAAASTIVEPLKNDLTNGRPASGVLCRVPLDKVQGVLKKPISPPPVVETPKATLASRKVLCLYCDRTFVSVSLRQKHVERSHSTKQFRRVSSRRQQNHFTSTPCVYCDKLTATEHTLKELFEHLILNHSQKYFGCLPCEDRFLNTTLLAEHNASAHRIFPEAAVLAAPAKAPTSAPETTPSKATSSEADEGVPVKMTRSMRQRKEMMAETKPAGKIIKKLLSKDLRGNKKLAVKSSSLALKRSKRLQAKVVVQSSSARRQQRRTKNSSSDGKKSQDHQQQQTSGTTSGNSGPSGISEKSLKAPATVNPYPEFDSFFRVKKITDHSIDNLKISSLTFDDVFDKAFFNRIQCNIQENLLHHIDGKLFKNEESESRISNFEKNSSPQEMTSSNLENYGCELSLNAVTPAVSLLSTQQFGEDLESQIEYGAKPASKKAKQQTKSGADQEVVHYKYFTRRKYQASILEHKENRDLSKLDMWTQYVIKNRQQKIIDDKKTPDEVRDYVSGEEYKTKVRREELNRILDRRGPFEDLREEASKKAAMDKLSEAGNDVNEESFSEIRELLTSMVNKVFEMVEESNNLVENQADVTSSEASDRRQIPSYLNLRHTSTLEHDSEIDRSDRIVLICSSQETENFELPSNTVRDKNEKVELTGEWARSRIFVCAACGLKLQNMKQLLEHKNIYHQYVWVQHYEMVGNQSELYRHLSIPGLGKVGVLEDNVQCKLWKRSEARLCSKCGKQCNSLGELHRHILECGGDWTWMLARKKCKYRPFGAKSRRKRRGLVKRIYTQKTEPSEKKIYKKVFDGPRPKPSDAETIQRMLANLPPKRATRKIMCLKDGLTRNTKQKQQQNPQIINQAKLKCGKVIHNSKVKTAENKNNSQNKEYKVKNNFKRPLRSLNKVLASRVLDTNSTLLLKRKLKNMNTRQTRQSNVRVEREEEEKEEENEQADEEEEVKVAVAEKIPDLIIEEETPSKVTPAKIIVTKKKKKPQVEGEQKEEVEIERRTSPRNEKNTSAELLPEPVAKVEKMNIKRFFPVRKKKSSQKSGAAEKSAKRKSEPEAKNTAKQSEEPAKVKKSTFSSLMRTLSLSKKKTESKNKNKVVESAVPEETELKRKRKFGDSFRNAVKKIKKLKVRHETEKPTETPVHFLEETSTGTVNPAELEKIVIPVIEEPEKSSDPAVDTSTPVPIVVNCTDEPAISGTVFDLHNENAVQAKGVEFDTLKVDTKLDGSVKSQNSPLMVSPKLNKGKIRKQKGLNDCIAMLTSKLNQSVEESSSINSIFSLMPSTKEPEKQCILKVPSIKDHLKLTAPVVEEVTALDLSCHSHQHPPQLLSVNSMSIVKVKEVENVSCEPKTNVDIANEVDLSKGETQIPDEAPLKKIEVPVLLEVPNVELSDLTTVPQTTRKIGLSRKARNKLTHSAQAVVLEIPEIVTVEKAVDLPVLESENIVREDNQQELLFLKKSKIRKIGQKRNKLPKRKSDDLLASKIDNLIAVEIKQRNGERAQPKLFLETNLDSVFNTREVPLEIFNKPGNDVLNEPLLLENKPIHSNSKDDLGNSMDDLVLDSEDELPLSSLLKIDGESLSAISEQEADLTKKSKTKRKKPAFRTTRTKSALLEKCMREKMLQLSGELHYCQDLMEEIENEIRKENDLQAMGQAEPEEIPPIPTIFDSVLAPENLRSAFEDRPDVENVVAVELKDTKKKDTKNNVDISIECKASEVTENTQLEPNVYDFTETGDQTKQDQELKKAETTKVNGEIKENDCEESANGRRRIARSAKAKALENILDDALALAELTESERNREVFQGNKKKDRGPKKSPTRRNKKRDELVDALPALNDALPQLDEALPATVEVLPSQNVVMDETNLPQTNRSDQDLSLMQQIGEKIVKIKKLPKFKSKKSRKYKKRPKSQKKKEPARKSKKLDEDLVEVLPELHEALPELHEALPELHEATPELHETLPELHKTLPELDEALSISLTEMLTNKNMVTNEEAVVEAEVKLPHENKNDQDLPLLQTVEKIVEIAKLPKFKSKKSRKSKQPKSSKKIPGNKNKKREGLVDLLPELHDADAFPVLRETLSESHETLPELHETLPELEQALPISLAEMLSIENVVANEGATEVNSLQIPPADEQSVEVEKLPETKSKKSRKDLKPLPVADKGELVKSVSPIEEQVTIDNDIRSLDVKSKKTRKNKKEIIPCDEIRQEPVLPSEAQVTVETAAKLSDLKSRQLKDKFQLTLSTDLEIDPPLALISEQMTVHDDMRQLEVKSKRTRNNKDIIPSVEVRHEPVLPSEAQVTVETAVKPSDLKSGQLQNNNQSTLCIDVDDVQPLSSISEQVTVHDNMRPLEVKFKKIRKNKKEEEEGKDKNQPALSEDVEIVQPLSSISEQVMVHGDHGSQEVKYKKSKKNKKEIILSVEIEQELVLPSEAQVAVETAVKLSELKSRHLKDKNQPVLSTDVEIVQPLSAISEQVTVHDDIRSPEVKYKKTRKNKKEIIPSVEIEQELVLPSEAQVTVETAVKPSELKSRQLKDNNQPVLSTDVEMVQPLSSISEQVTIHDDIRPLEVKSKKSRKHKKDISSVEIEQEPVLPNEAQLAVKTAVKQSELKSMQLKDKHQPVLYTDVEMVQPLSSISEQVTVHDDMRPQEVKYKKTRKNKREIITSVEIQQKPVLPSEAQVPVETAVKPSELKSRQLKDKNQPALSEDVEIVQPLSSISEQMTIHDDIIPLEVKSKKSRKNKKEVEVEQEPVLSSEAEDVVNVALEQLDLKSKKSEGTNQPVLFTDVEIVQPLSSISKKMTIHDDIRPLEVKFKKSRKNRKDISSVEIEQEPGLSSEAQVTVETAVKPSEFKSRQLKVKNQPMLSTDFEIVQPLSSVGQMTIHDDIRPLELKSKKSRKNKKEVEVEQEPVLSSESEVVVDVALEQLDLKPKKSEGKNQPVLTAELQVVQAVSSNLDLEPVDDIKSFEVKSKKTRRSMKDAVQSVEVEQETLLPSGLQVTVEIASKPLELKSKKTKDKKQQALTAELRVVQSKSSNLEQMPLDDDTNSLEVNSKNSKKNKKEIIPVGVDQELMLPSETQVTVVKVEMKPSELKSKKLKDKNQSASLELQSLLPIELPVDDFVKSPEVKSKKNKNNKNVSLPVPVEADYAKIDGEKAMEVAEFTSSAKTDVPVVPLVEREAEIEGYVEDVYKSSSKAKKSSARKDKKSDQIGNTLHVPEEVQADFLLDIVKQNIVVETDKKSKKSSSKKNKKHRKSSLSSLELEKSDNLDQSSTLLEFTQHNSSIEHPLEKQSLEYIDDTSKTSSLSSKSTKSPYRKNKKSKEASPAAVESALVEPVIVEHGILPKPLTEVISESSVEDIMPKRVTRRSTISLTEENVEIVQIPIFEKVPFIERSAEPILEVDPEPEVETKTKKAHPKKKSKRKEILPLQTENSQLIEESVVDEKVQEECNDQVQDSVALPKSLEFEENEIAVPGVDETSKTLNMELSKKAISPNKKIRSFETAELSKSYEFEDEIADLKIDEIFSTPNRDSVKKSKKSPKKKNKKECVALSSLEFGDNVTVTDDETKDEASKTTILIEKPKKSPNKDKKEATVLSDPFEFEENSKEVADVKVGETCLNSDLGKKSKKSPNKKSKNQVAEISDPFEFEEIDEEIEDVKIDESSSSLDSSKKLKKSLSKKNTKEPVELSKAVAEIEVSLPYEEISHNLDKSNKSEVSEDSLKRKSPDDDTESPQELRRSKRNSRKVTSYNEAELAEQVLEVVSFENVVDSEKNSDLILKPEESKEKPKMNSDELFDLLKATPNENHVLSKPPVSTFLNNFDEISDDFNDDNFDMFENILEKSMAVIEENLAADRSLPLLEMNLERDDISIPEPLPLESELAREFERPVTPKDIDIQMQEKLLGEEIESKLDSLTPVDTAPKAPSKKNSKKNKKKKSDKVIHCEICDRSFRIDNLNKHQRTLVHISKLSEIEAREAELKAKKQSEDIVEITSDSSKNDLNLFEVLDNIESASKDDGRESPASFTINNQSLKLADIIDDVLNKPSLSKDDEKHNFSDIIMQNPDQLETRRYKSLGERKSFDADQPQIVPKDPPPPPQVPPPQLDYFDSTRSNEAGTILQKQLTLLQNMIENRTNLSYIDDISISSAQSENNSLVEVESVKQNESLYSSVVLKADSFLKPTQYEEISEDSTNLRSYDDQKSRKALNRDEELFLECCSLLKSSSEVSNYSKKSNKLSKVLNNLDLKSAEEPDWLENKSFSRSADNFQDSSRIPTPLGDNFVNDESNSNTIASNWNMTYEGDKDKPSDGAAVNRSFSFEEVLNEDEKAKDKNIASKFGGVISKALHSFKSRQRGKKRNGIISDDESSSSMDLDINNKTTAEDLSDSSTTDSKKMLTKGAMKVFEGLKVSIPTEELNMKEVLNKCISQPTKNSQQKSIATTTTTAPTTIKATTTRTTTTTRKNPTKKLKLTTLSAELFSKITNRKKPAAKISKKKSIDIDALKVHDVYDFEETQDNSDVFAKPDFRSFRNKKTEELLKATSDIEDGGDSLSFEASSTSSVSEAPKKAKSEQNITKKKCMIMGRIFKNAAAKSRIEEEIREIPIADSAQLVEDFVRSCPKPAEDVQKKPKMTEEEMNKAFDMLLNGETHAVEKPPAPLAETKPVENQKKKSKVKYKKRSRCYADDETDDEFSLSKLTKKRTHRKNEDNSINLEQELKECIGVASRKSQRKCTSGKQNVLVEYWSSDESTFEIPEPVVPKAAEKEKTFTDFVKPFDLIEKPVEKVSEPIVDEVVKEVAKATPENKTKQKKSKPRDTIEPSTTGASSNRRKRAAANPLYHWSSSSEDESSDLILVKPIRDETEDDEDRPVQHGWIVGDSPKKLVTMLAQAKGKKLGDVDSVKEQGKKRTTAYS